MKRFHIPTLLVGAVLGAANLAHTQTATEMTAISDYHAALDLVSQGKGPSAQLLLETDAARGDLAPESAALLAYLEEKAGQGAAAKRTLENLAAPTAFTAAYLTRLGGATTPEMPFPREMGAGAENHPATLAATDARVTKLEKLMWQIVNAERTGRGLSPLAWNDGMASVSRAHSAEMRDKKYFAHESPTPGLREPLDRYVAGIGQTPRLVAENIYRVWGSRSFLTETDIRDAHKSLMNSPGHRSNLLLDGATKMGIGIAANASGDIWITQMFASVSN